MPGVANAQIVLTSPSGKTKYKLTFTGGITHGAKKTPAKFSTSSPIIQDVIENNNRFKKDIFLLTSFNTPAAPAPESPVKPMDAIGKNGNRGRVIGGRKAKNYAEEQEPTTEVKKEQQSGPQVFEEVTTLGDAITILMQAGPVAGENLTSLEGVLQVAKELGISFPNLNKE